jgi:hypothetical protein
MRVRNEEIYFIKRVAFPNPKAETAIYLGETMKKFYVVAAVVASALMPLAAQAQSGGFGRPGGGPGNAPGGPGFGRGMRNNPKTQLTRLVNRIGQLEKGSARLTVPQAKSVVGIISPWSKKNCMTENEAKTLLTRLNGVLTAKQKSELEKLGPGGRDGGRGEGRGDGRGPRGDGERRGDGGPRGGLDRGGFGGQGRPEGRGPGGPGGEGRGPGGPGGGGRPSEAQMKAIQTFFQNYNPFYPPSNYKEVKALPDRMEESFVNRYRRQQAVISQLTQKAKGGR